MSREEYEYLGLDFAGIRKKAFCPALLQSFFPIPEFSPKAGYQHVNRSQPPNSNFPKQYQFKYTNEGNLNE
jgi:hypothetical protein